MYAPRTVIGQQGVLSKEYPWLFLPRRFFFGLLEVPQYAYDWGYSKAYIELMCSDTTLIQYPNDSKEAKAQDRDERAAEARRWMERKAQQNKQSTQTIKLKD